MSFLSRLGVRLSSCSEVLLALLVITILSLMVLPVPAPVVDWLVALNIAIAAAVLFVSLFVAEAIRLPGMPTILLLTTLFRLALNVTTTKLILLDANAGEIIRSFGEFVVGGNFVVGAIVFIVLVLVQFIVIAKGSERVAEVAARFTLDAMPGHQMSIDADLRSGLITEDEARARRRLMDRQSKLYGAMDGAMKFVKGDAIAGIVISLVNIVGGVLIGLLDFGYSPGKAIQVFGILTIGDGLVSQIPALLISVSAGLVVTRVAGSDDGKESRVARDIGAQLLEKPLSVYVAGGFLLALAASSPWTGFPWPPFLAFGLAACCAAEVRRRLLMGKSDPAGRGQGEPSGREEAAGPGEVSDKEVGYQPPALLLELHVGIEKAWGLDDRDRKQAFDGKLKKIREDLSCELGFAVPAVRIGFTARQLPAKGYAIYAFDGLLASGQIAIGAHYVLASHPEASARVPGLLPATCPGTRWRIALAEGPEQLAAARAADLRIASDEDVLLGHLKICLRQNAAELITFQEVSRLIDTLREAHPNLVQAVIPTLFPLQDIVEVLKRLLREQVSIRDLRRVLEAMSRLRLGPDQKLPAIVAELVRLDMKKAICSRFAIGRKRMDYYLVSPEIQEQLQDEAEGRALAPDERDRIRTSLARGIDPARHQGSWPVLLVPPLLRATTFALIEGVLPEVAVLSTQEVSSEILLRYMATIKLGADDPAEVPGGLVAADAD